MKAHFLCSQFSWSDIVLVRARQTHVQALGTTLSTSILAVVQCAVQNAFVVVDGSFLLLFLYWHLLENTFQWPLEYTVSVVLPAIQAVFAHSSLSFLSVSKIQVPIFMSEMTTGFRHKHTPVGCTASSKTLIYFWEEIVINSLPPSIKFILIESQAVHQYEQRPGHVCRRGGHWILYLFQGLVRLRVNSRCWELYVCRLNQREELLDQGWILFLLVIRVMYE